MIKFKIFTLFPEIFSPYLNCSIIGDALKRNIWEFEAINFRDFSNCRHQNVDDYPYGGGAGMVMKPDVIGNAIESKITNLKTTKIIYLSPRGKVFNQQKALELSKEKEIALICGRFEGIDQRAIDYYQMEEISVGDYVLSGGELPAMILIDAILRNIEGVIGDPESLKEESFGIGDNCDFANLLEYPHYTKPANWKDLKIPEILLSGHHQKIKEWRLAKAKEITLSRRPDLGITNKKI